MVVSLLFVIGNIDAPILVQNVITSINGSNISQF